jgi:hypothetical protein
VSAPEAAGLEGPFRVNPHEWGLFNLGLCRHLRPARKLIDRVSVQAAALNPSCAAEYYHG